MSIRIEDIDGMGFSDVADLSAGRLEPVHPGAILLEEWLKPLGISRYVLAKAIGVAPRRISEIVKGRRGITVDTALRLAAFFGADAQIWLNLQTHYDTQRTRVKMRGILERIRHDAAAHALS